MVIERLPVLAALTLASVVLVQPAVAGGQETPPVYRVVAEPSEVVVEVGGSVPLEVLAYDEAGDEVQVALRFAAPRTGLLVRDGQVLGRQVGDYHIHVSLLVPDGPRSVPASIYVQDPPPGMPRGPAPVLEIPVKVVWPAVDRVEISPSQSVLYAGARVRHRAIGYHADGSVRTPGQGVRWRSSDESVATVDRHGYVAARREGSVTITAVIEGTAGSLDYDVQPFPAERIELEGGMEMARTGDVLRFSARAYDAEGRVLEDVPIEWTYVFEPQDSVVARGAGAAITDGNFVAQVPGVYTVTALAGHLAARTTVEAHPRRVLHRAHVVGHGAVNHAITRDFWVWEASDGRDYAITGSAGFAYIWDVTDPANMVRTDSIFVDARQVNDVKVSPDGRYAALTREGASDRRNGVVILDLANPRHPTIAAEHTDGLTGGVHNAWPENDYLYALSGGQRYVIIDMSDINNPRNVGSYNHPNSSIHDVIVHDGLAYSSEWENGIIVVDVGNGRWGGSPDNPVFVKQVHFPEMLTHTIFPYYQESTSRFYLFASDELWPRVGTPLEGFADLIPYDPETGEGGRPAHTGGYVHIIDFTDPENPEKVARYQMDEYGTHNPWVEDDILYQAYYEGGVRIVDVSGELKGDLRSQGREMVVFKPYDPTGFIANAPMVWSAMPFKGHVFFADANSGLWAIRIEPREGRPVL